MYRFHLCWKELAAYQNKFLTIVPQENITDLNFENQSDALQEAQRLNTIYTTRHFYVSGNHYTCTLCGKTDIFSIDENNKDFGDLVYKKYLCFSCAFWTNIVDTKFNSETSLLMPNYVLYHASSFTTQNGLAPKGKMNRGLFGVKYVGERLSGEIIFTDNLWLIGTVPEHFRKFIIPNMIHLDPIYQAPWFISKENITLEVENVSCDSATT